MVENKNDICTLKPFLKHLFNNYSLMSIPRVVEIIFVELKRNCLVWTGIHEATGAVCSFSSQDIYFCVYCWTLS